MGQASFAVAAPIKGVEVLCNLDMPYIFVFYMCNCHFFQIYYFAMSTTSSDSEREEEVLRFKESDPSAKDFYFLKTIKSKEC